MKLPAPAFAEAASRRRHRVTLPGNVEIIIGSALTPLRESVTALPA